MKVAFMTKQILRKLPRLYATERVPFDDKVVVVKYFNPYGAGTWYGVEFDGTDLFFGVVVLNGAPAWGYFSLAEMAAQKATIFGRTVNCQGIERERYWTPAKWSDVRSLDCIVA